ncbi:site-specific integrase, partial [Tropicimonas sp. TH_r6]|uniref:site-specific integrase n=1 Tax=Tropicimonas sp. TH_r6 TaxID=3082085 RepID=UPI0029534253
MARLWFCEADTTAGRIGDMHHLGQKNLKDIEGDAFLIYQPQKRGSKKVSAPVQEALARELDLHDLSRKTFLVTEHGKPSANSGSLDNRVRKWIKRAGLVDLNGRVTHSQHGSRNGVATAMGEDGSSLFEIMALLGHSDPR